MAMSTGLDQQPPKELPASSHHEVPRLLSRIHQRAQA